MVHYCCKLGSWLLNAELFKGGGRAGIILSATTVN